jgi:Zn-finger nucleic acid-binding protein
VKDVMCPWCEADLVLEAAEERDGQTCPECLTAWSYVDEREFELAAAA